MERTSPSLLSLDRSLSIAPSEAVPNFSPSVPFFRSNLFFARIPKKSILSFGVSPSGHYSTSEWFPLAFLALTIGDELIGGFRNFFFSSLFPFMSPSEF